MPLIYRDTPCPGCGYNLRGLEQQHRCPECGHRYDFRPGVGAGTADVPRFGRMNLFDKLCAFVALLLGLIFLGSSELVPPRQSQGAEIKVLLVGPQRSKVAGGLSASRPSVHHRGLHRGVPLRRGTRGRSPE